MSTTGESAGPQTQKQELNDALSSIDKIFKSPMTVGGRKSYVVSPDRLGQLERRITRALEFTPEGVQVNDLIVAHDRIEQLEVALKEQAAAQAKLDAELKLKAASLLEKSNELSTAKKNLETFKQANLSSDRALKEAMGKARAEADRLNKEIASAKSGNDVSLATALKKAKDANAKDIQDLSAQLARVNSEVRKQNSEITKLHKVVQELEMEKATLSGQATQLKNALVAGEERFKEGLHLSAAIEKLLGPEACLILGKWHTLAFDDAREQLFTLRTAMQKSKNKHLQGLGKLLQTALEWAKKKAYQVRKSIIPWIKIILADLENARLKTISFYRDELKAIIEAKTLNEKNKKEEAKAAGADPDEEKSWFEYLAEETIAWTRVIYNRSKRRSVNFFKNVGQSFRNVWVRVFGSRKGKEPMVEKKPRVPLFQSFRKVWRTTEANYEKATVENAEEDEVLFDAEDFHKVELREVDPVPLEQGDT